MKKVVTMILMALLVCQAFGQGRGTPNGGDGADQRGGQERSGRGNGGARGDRAGFDAGILVDGNGQAILINRTIVESEDGNEVQTNLSAYGESGAVWQFDLEDYAGFRLRGRQIAGTDLLLSLRPIPQPEERVEGEDAGQRFLATTTFVCVDTNGGAEKWSYTQMGAGVSVKSNGQGGWFISYASATDSGFDVHLALLENGVVSWDIVTRSVVRMDQEEN